MAPRRSSSKFAIIGDNDPQARRKSKRLSSEAKLHKMESQDNGVAKANRSSYFTKTKRFLRLLFIGNKKSSEKVEIDVPSTPQNHDTMQITMNWKPCGFSTPMVRRRSSMFPTRPISPNITLNGTGHLSIVSGLPRDLFK